MQSYASHSCVCLVLFLIHESSESIDAVFAAGADDYVAKPVRETVLCQRVRRLLNEYASIQRADDHERRWHQAFHQNHAIKLLIDSQTGAILDANRAACSFYGYTLEEFRRKHVADLDATLDATQEGLPPTLFNFRHRLASGEIRDVKVFSGPIDVGGRTLIYSIIHDNTKRRQAEAAEHDHRTMADALRKMGSALSSTLDQNEVLDRILQQIQQVVSNDCANIMLIDGGFARIVRSRGYEQWSTPEDINAIRLPLAEATNLRWMIEQGRPLVIHDVQAYPGWAHVETTLWIRSYVGAPIRFGHHTIGFLNLDSRQSSHFSEQDAERLLAFADQAAIAIRNARLYDRVRRQAAELEQRIQDRTVELEYERQQFRTILDAMVEGVAYTEHSDDQIKVRYINQALVTMTGYSVEEWTAHSIQLFRTEAMGDDQFQRGVDEFYDTLIKRGYWQHEFRMRRKDGTEFDMNSVTTRVDSPDGKSVGAVTVIRDVSQERALQAQKTRFVAYASHELRTPITNMKTRLYLMRKQPEKIPDHLSVLEDVTDRMQRLVEDLLDMSRFERGIIHLKRGVLLLQEIIHRSASVQEPEAERKGLCFTVELPDEPLYAFVDPERVVQVITNLLTNAINYTPPGKNVTARLSRTEENGVSYGLVEVIDTGIGIAQEHLPHIFQPFYRVVSQVEGTGLGLNISKEIVELHDGKIGVESTLKQGSRFYFSLPIVPAPVPTDDDSILPEHHEQHTART